MSEVGYLADSVEFDKSEVETSIPGRFARQLGSGAGAVAAIDQGTAVTYGQLDALSNQLAHRLLEDYGEQPLRVGLAFALSIDAIAAHLGVWKAGKVCVPIDPAFPPARTAKVLNDAQAALTIVAESQLESMRSLNVAERVLGIHGASERMPGHAPDVAISPDDPAAIIYVSGSTGRPTGIVQTHRSTLHRCWSDTQYFQVSSRDRISLMASPGLGTGVPQILLALLNGASLHPFDLRQRHFEDIYEWLWSERISIFHPPVSAFRQFLEGCPVRERYDDCRFVIQAGEPTLATTVEGWRAHFPPPCALVCQLVSTETQVVSRYSVTHDQQIEDRYVPIGYADCDKQLSIVDSKGNLVDRGEIGKLVVSSRFLSPGIWDCERSECIPWPDAGIGSMPERIASIRTSDLVCLDARGRLQHHGRSDSAIKLRGYRIDFSEIESALLEFESISATVCVARELENHRWQIVAFYVPIDADSKPCDDDLRHWLRARIPEYMVPARFLAVAELPRTINGKIARRAVENLEIVQRSRGRDLHSFENELQRRFVEIWRATIGHDDIGIDDDFFDIGGDSLSALQVSAAISRCIGRAVPFSKIVELRNIRRIVEDLDRTDEPISCVSLLSSTPRRNARRPLFCIEGLYRYQPLAEALGPKWQTVGVQASPEIHLQRTYSVDGRRSGQPAGTWPPSIEQLAATYIGQIRRHQRTGPYQLAGVGFGGVVAFEMARQLTNSGETVSLLGMFDSIAPGALRPVSPRGWLSLASVWVRNSIPVAVPDSRSNRRDRERLIARSQAAALMKYRPPAWDGNAVLFCAADPIRFPGLQIARNLGWDRLIAGQLSGHTIPGDRFAMLRTPNVESVASLLRRFLDARL